MIIEGEDFKIEGKLGRFDLSLLKVIHANKADKRREELTHAGYSMSFETCLKRIVDYRLDKKQEIYTLKEYLKAYRLENKILKSILEE